MSDAGTQRTGEEDDAIVRRAAAEAEAFLASACSALRGRLAAGGRLSGAVANAHQRDVHGLAWIATTTQAIKQVADWSDRRRRQGSLNAADELAVSIGLGEYLNQLVGGIPMSQNEIVRPAELGLEEPAAALASGPAAVFYLRHGNTAENRKALADLASRGELPGESLDDEALDLMRAECRKFTQNRITPHAHRWHLEDALVPDEVVAEMGALGFFRVDIPSSHGGLDMGKLAMCIVTEELSTGWLGAGSLGTRSEIAAELIGMSGSPEQQAQWLPGIAEGSVLPAAVCTEPDTGSDLARVRMRARRLADATWRLDGNKTWITHAARSDLFMILARSEENRPGHGGLSMFLAPKSRPEGRATFPDRGLDGSEIPVLGYRGMREYELAFSDFAVPAEGILGGREGEGFQQLMRSFEAARIQTAARGLGVARRALELGVDYARERRQFGNPIIAFPRVADKLALMIAELLMARELTHFAARQKDGGKRCDLEAGMAKLLSARVAWSNADAGLQIHGGNGYALEYEISRILCDARILNILEGAAEIQAHVVGRRLLDVA